MNIKAILLLSAVGLLAACGGSSDGSALNPAVGAPKTTFTTLRVFGDGYGVARATAANGKTALIITPYVQDIVADQNNSPDTDITDLNVSDFQIVQQLPTNAILRTGTISGGGVTLNTTILEDLGDKASLFLFEIPNEGSMAIATGEAFGSAPSGTFSYTGTMVTSRRQINLSPELGSFSLSANFDNNLFTYNGSTNSNTVNGAGTIDAVNGRFATNSLSVNTGGLQRTGTLYGQIHGGSAESVSGVFHTNETTPSYAGAFVGSR